MADEQNQLYSRYNTDDVFNRSVIGGLLYLLNNKITYQQIFQDNVVETVHVPCAYNFSFSNDQRFLQDNYTNFGRACFGDLKIDGKFDMIPRMAITYTGSQIDAGNITNRFIKGKYMKNENGRLVSYESYLYAMPLTFSFDVEVWCDNLITAFKIEEAIRRVFYKNKTYNVLYRGMKIPCCVGFPESNTLSTKTMNYEFNNVEHILKINFTLAVEAYQPVFDDELAIEAGNIIEFVGWDVKTPGTEPKMSLKFENIKSGDKLVSGTTNLIEWKSLSNVSDMCTVVFSYITPDGVEHKETEMTMNQNCYYWLVPQTISNFEQPTITLLDSDTIKVEEQPKIKIAPNIDGVVDASSFLIIEDGKFSGVSSGYLNATIEYIDECGNAVISTSYIFNIVNGKIFTEHPVSVCGNILVFPKMDFYNKISLKLTYPLDNSIYDQIDNILII